MRKIPKRRRRRGNAKIRRERRRREYRSFSTRARRATSLFASPAARQCACGAPAARSLGEAAQHREPRAQARGQTSPQIRASERRHNPPEASRPRGMLVPASDARSRDMREKKTFPQDLPAGTFFSGSFRASSHLRRRREATSASAPKPASRPNADGSGIAAALIANASSWVNAESNT